MTFHLLNYAPTRALVAAPTTSLHERMQAFRQHYDADGLDASALLLGRLGFLPPNDPRFAATVARIEARLTRGGLVFRFDPEQISSPLGDAEGAFLPCTFWLVAGEPDRAEAFLGKRRSSSAMRSISRRFSRSPRRVRSNGRR
ncbi:glycoside hydrolase family 15 protein [Aurantimonas sp. C2-6-R+9]|uniref:glycoside hydrolase family 15 protein n=1 Tax=unclassified Aurantimonas TaxID=2638230 RepID=UPI002E17B0C1|nr:MULTISPECIES: glycoside hydrolase family 15 protein [unclassified Aurantimonas]MEC5292324.1 glycoside hydrolase family 15 protein [Aurantimonas sp. C2-3-R2]MEC5382572.1 glycoside hydrolase family 15 protein [Aurantimonas sp. C2-6-R+9]MEC5413409.1 glycoside hydrolase family 15 protein [Aurantimonas sp. C2-4-R8]